MSVLVQTAAETVGRPARMAAQPLAAQPLVSVVIPARDEGERIAAVLVRLDAVLRRPAEVLVVVDSAADPTVAAVEATAASQPRVRCLVNGYDAGPAGAIRFGMDRASAPVIAVTMADGSDDLRQIDDLAALVEDGAVVAAASRYAPGGHRVGGPLVKSALSRLAGTSLQLLARPGTSDATNSFKAYSAEFVRAAGVDSRQGFCVGLELTAKARRLGLGVAEIPTRWHERESGQSAFRLLRWLPSYLRWYLFCFGRPLTFEELAARRPGTRRWPGARRQPGELRG